MSAPDYPQSHNYRIAWYIDVEAQSALDAVLSARAMQLNPESIANVFTVRSPDGLAMCIDLESGEEYPSDQSAANAENLEGEPTRAGTPVRRSPGPTLRGQTPRGTVQHNSQHSRWKCPKCGSINVQVSLPVWFREYQDGCLVEISVDEEADPSGWYCEDCTECEAGSPILTEEERSSAPGFAASPSDPPVLPEIARGTE